VSRAIAASREAARAGVIRDYLELSKARIVVMILITTSAGFAIGSVGRYDWLAMMHVLIGTAMVAAGTNALNQYFERDLDAMMARTRRRPLPAGRISERSALAFSVGISILGVVWLAVAANPLTAAIAATTLATYLFAYTPMKRRSDLCTLIGAVPGALPPMIGWAGASGSLEIGAWLMFAIMFLWQMPHFLAISWIYREDYGRAGFTMISLRDDSGIVTSTQAFLYAALLIPVSLLPAVFHVASGVYFMTALVAGAGFAVAAMRFMQARTMRSAKILFGTSNLYLIVVMGLLVATATR
jgi:protoheme IX farnesyltransferase